MSCTYLELVKLIAHIGVCLREVGLLDSLLEHEVDDPLQALLVVDLQVLHLLHQSIKLLGCELVQDATELLVQFLKRKINVTIIK